MSEKVFCERAFVQSGCMGVDCTGTGDGTVQCACNTRSCAIRCIERACPAACKRVLWTWGGGVGVEYGLWRRLSMGCVRARPPPCSPLTRRIRCGTVTLETKCEFILQTTAFLARKRGGRQLLSCPLPLSCDQRFLLVVDCACVLLTLGLRR